MGNKQILKLAHVTSSLILPSSQMYGNLPRELTSQRQCMLNWTMHPRPVLQILGPASHFQDLVSNANPLSTFQVDGSNFFYIRKVPSPLAAQQVFPQYQVGLPHPTESSSSFPELPLSQAPTFSLFESFSMTSSCNSHSQRTVTSYFVQSGPSWFQLETFLFF